MALGLLVAVLPAAGSRALSLLLVVYTDLFRAFPSIMSTISLLGHTGSSDGTGARASNSEAT